MPNWRLKLNGRENQDIRFLIHSCQRSIVAIGECSRPLLDEILPLASEHPSILSALLAYSARLRVSSGDGSAARTEGSKRNALDRYQETITKVQSILSRLQSENPVNDGDVMEVLASCLLLTLFGLPEQVHNWSVHVTGMIALVESLDIEGFRSVPLVRYLQTVAAHLDISAFALNRSEASQHKWLAWGICPWRSSTSTIDEPTEFTTFEISSGYPETLVTVVALISAVIEGQMDDSVAAYINDIYQGIHPVQEQRLAEYGSPQQTESYWTSRMHAIIAGWEPPMVPPHISSTLSLALTTAWETIRKAAHIYLTRGGFATSIYIPVAPRRQRVNQRYVREMIVGLQSLITLAEKKGITIANAMIWPMTVIGNEIFNDYALQAELVSMFERLHRYFRIAHLTQVLDLLKELWQRFSMSDAMLASPQPSRELSLQILAAEKNLSVPLF
ncbi:hypothetical protein AFCA_009930 [Aspergillus flavus]|uniref:Fungal-specific transcription factor domain-containing protein n=1 Tax=Aspergillus flavus TaxID=5059 RepID=A0AB74CAT1_ASPFL|nr:hypothetical protein G4B11_009296 [Aspergillus flavus]RMZ42211.1 hypothetical protein CA14_002786 [Aspergillus flavus]UDD62617.1 hypothetical protein AFCA_009930 [Aspergillus flavus]